MDEHNTNKIRFISLIHVTVVIIISVLIYLFSEKDFLMSFLISALIGFSTYTGFLIYLLNKLKNKESNLTKISRIYAMYVFLFTMIYALIFYFFLNQEYLWIYIIPLMGTVMINIVPKFFKSEKIEKFTGWKEIDSHKKILYFFILFSYAIIYSSISFKFMSKNAIAFSLASIAFFSLCLQYLIFGWVYSFTGYQKGKKNSKSFIIYLTALIITIYFLIKSIITFFN